MSTEVQALRWHAAHDIRLDLVTVEPPSEGYVEVSVAYCGVCGSDLHEIADGPHAIPVGSPHALSGISAPIILGHEFAGVVSAVGPGVGEVAVGDAVVVEPNYRCGRCPQCRMGRYHTCSSFGFAGLMGNGGLAERATVPAYMAHRLPAGFDLAVAALLEPAAVALHAVRRSSFRAGQTAAVVGLGPIGLLVGRLLAIKGAEAVIGVDPDAGRRAVALDFGFDAAIDSDSGHSALAADGGVDVSFEAVGRQGAFDLAVSLTRAGGTVMLLGLAQQLSISAFEFVNDEKTLRASVGYNDCHRELIELIESGSLDLRPLITTVVPLADAPALLTDMAGGSVAGIKTLVDCRPVTPIAGSRHSAWRRHSTPTVSR
ncbi:alcohol dehydrogenase catalytic domain-containing protein [Mycolicibacterium sp. CBM1]